MLLYRSIQIFYFFFNQFWYFVFSQKLYILSRSSNLLAYKCLCYPLLSLKIIFMRFLIMFILSFLILVILILSMSVQLKVYKLCCTFSKPTLGFINFLYYVSFSALFMSSLIFLCLLLILCGVSLFFYSQFLKLEIIDLSIS